MKKKYLLLTLPLLASLVACNGGSSASSSTTPSNNQDSETPTTSVVPSTSETPSTSESTSESTSSSSTTPSTSESTSESTSSSSNSETTSSPSTTPSTGTSNESSSSSETITLQEHVLKVNKTSTNEVNSSVFKLTDGLKAVTSGCYGTGTTAVRLGSRSKDGLISIKFSNSVKVQRVEITAKSYSSDGSAPLRVTLESGQANTLNVEKQSVYTFNFNSNKSVKSLDIETTKTKKRVEISEVHIFTVGGDVNIPVEPDNRKSLSYTSSFELTEGKMPKTKEQYDGYYRPALNDNLNIQNYHYFTSDDALVSTGNKKLLVVPVDFTDYRASKLGETEENSQQRIFDTFFGNSEDTGWESLRTYYEKSSYGALTFEGEVTPWYHSTYSTKEFFKLNESTNPSYDPTWTMLDEVTEWATTALNIDISEYDQNKDGLVDGVWMVYSCPTSYYEEKNSNRDVYWAYTFGNYDNLDKILDSNDPNLILPFKYCWASYHFMDEGGYNKVDAHTFIHETGHMMGLDDYYSYDENEIYGNVEIFKEGVSGGVDMMDLNIGDHGAYSKYLLNWTSPYVIDGTKNEVNINLKPFESSGEFILLKDQFNDSPYDEYLMIEYYTPTGLNFSDSKGYASGFNSYTKPGIKISHVDSRIALVDVDYSGKITSGTYVNAFDENDLTGENGYLIGASNTPTYSYAFDLTNNDPYRLLHLIEADNEYTFNGLNFSDKYGKNQVLFHEGDTFSMEKYNKFFTRGNALNDQSKLPYVITIGATNSDNSITINIKK